MASISSKEMFTMCNRRHKRDTNLFILIQIISIAVFLCIVSRAQICQANKKKTTLQIGTPV